MTLASAIKNAKIILGASDVGENYTGFMASVKMYDYAMDKEEVEKAFKQTKKN
jgi:hypothetical protein